MHNLSEVCLLRIAQRRGGNLYCHEISTTGTCNGCTAAEGANLVGITKQEDTLQSFHTQRLQSCSVEFYKRLCWVDNRLDGVVEDVRNRLLLLSRGFKESLNVFVV